jgi:hypothetical protein
MKTKTIIGWREWISLPELGIPRIKAKIDTGARTSALHAFEVDPYKAKRGMRVKFFMHPFQQDKKIIVECDALIKDHRSVTDSGGHREKRYVIETSILLGENQWPIEITLTDRETMKFRMLLGRTAMKGRKIVVDPGRSFLLGK